MATIFVDDKPYAADSSQNLLHNCLSLGFDLPYFCWHPALGSVGACRQCAVKQFRDETDKKGKLVMACMTPASDGTRISISDSEAAAFRAAIIEGLMTNHPHDCPVCDEGGECHLQDMTVMTGHDYRRYAFDKRTFRNQYLGPFVNHEMNRCIQCYRCVRYYREYAGGDDLNAFRLRNIVFFGRHEEGVLENEFSGNLVEVCPTGVFTDATSKRHYTRKWDLQMAPSVCVHCGLGCNTTAAERYGVLRRIVNRYHGDVNRYFLCDRGRFGYEFVNSAKRLRAPLLRRAGKSESLSRKETVDLLAGFRRGQAIGIGSPRASLEANFALRQFVGSDRFYLGISDTDFRLLSTMLDILTHSPVHSPSLREIELSDAVLVLGEDVTGVAPRMALSLRQSVRQRPMKIAEKLRIPLWLDQAVREAVQDERGPFFIASSYATRLDEVATETYRAAPLDIARLGFAIARALDPRAPATGAADDATPTAHRIADALANAERPLVISGFGCRSPAVIQAAANVALALSSVGKPAALSFIAPECNSIGLGLIGGAPLSQAFRVVENEQAENVVILENDLYRHADERSVTRFLEKARHVVLLDHVVTRTTPKAELAVPAGTFAESSGTLVSSEGRAQRFFAAYRPQEPIQDSWRWLRDGMLAAGDPRASWENLDDVVADLASAIPMLARITEAALPAAFRMADERIPREPHRYSGRTAMQADIQIHEVPPPADPDSPLSYSMEGYPKQPPASVTPFFWAPRWNSYQALNKFQEEVGGPLRGGNPGVRLIRAPEDAERRYFDWSPEEAEPHPGEWRVIPLFHIFGSEELSRLAPAVAELMPEPYLAVRPDDAARLGINAGDFAALRLSEEILELPVAIRTDLPNGCVGLPWGLPLIEQYGFPTWVSISRKF